MKKHAKKQKDELSGLYGVLGKTIEANAALSIYSAFSKSLR